MTFRRPFSRFNHKLEPATHRKEKKIKTPTKVLVYSNRDMRRIKRTTKQIDKLNAQLDSRIAS